MLISVKAYREGNISSSPKIKVANKSKISSFEVFNNINFLQIR